MRCSRALVVPSAALVLLLGIGAGCTTTPSPAPPAAPTTSTLQAASPDHSAHSHHSHHHGGAKALAHANPHAPTSFAERPDVGTEFTCPVSGGVFEVEPRTRVSFYKGRYYAMCCGGCAQDFDSNPAHFVEALEKTGSNAH